ncbi:unnamed protein product, partial [Discosporangium mesarthrocarpum]
RSLGEVTKYLVYNMRKRQEGGDSAEKYFNCTEQVKSASEEMPWSTFGSPRANLFLFATYIIAVYQLAESEQPYQHHTVAGIQDTRFQAMMPDPLHWLGVTKIHRFISMS